jgi:hypothetical protein
VNNSLGGIKIEFFSVEFTYTKPTEEIKLEILFLVQILIGMKIFEIIKTIYRLNISANVILIGGLTSFEQKNEKFIDCLKKNKTFTDYLFVLIEFLHQA